MPRHKTRPKDGIYQRPDSPFWWACYQKPGGGSARRSTGVPVAEDPDGLTAQAVRAGWRAAGHTATTGNGATFDDLLLAYMSEVTPTKRAPERDRWSAKALFPTFTGRALASIGVAEVRGYIASRAAGGIAPATINKEIGLMSAALNWARKELEWDVANPWESRRLREPAGRNRWLTAEEADALLAEAARKRDRSPHLHDFIRLILHTGMRSGEALGLEWSRVDLRGDRILFEAGHQKNGKLGTVPINQEAREALLSRARFRATHCPASPWVFCDRAGGRIASVKTSFTSCVAAAGLADVHPHDLRRTFGSWLVQAGVGIDRVSELLRHGDVAITARVYAHLRPSDLADAVAVLDRNWFSRGFSRGPETASAENKKPALTG